MRKEEQRLWDSMRRAAPPRLWMVRVENSVAEGMPDVWIGGRNGRHAWVELKAAQVPVRATTPLLGRSGLRVSQSNWFRKAASRGLPVYLLARDSAMDLYLLPATEGDSVNAMTREQLRAASLAASWREVFEELTHEN